MTLQVYDPLAAFINAFLVIYSELLTFKMVPEYRTDYRLVTAAAGQILNIACSIICTRVLDSIYAEAPVSFAIVSVMRSAVELGLGLILDFRVKDQG